MPSSIVDLPEEVLIMVLKETPYELDECQRVCRAWYLPAHLLFLKWVQLEGPSQIEQFIKAIDYNSKPSYLNAVQEIHIYNSFDAADDPDDVPLSRENISKLFCRFRNLKKVSIECSFAFIKEFNDEICEDLIKSCPKLGKFELEVENSDRESLYCDGLYKLRRLVTRIDINKMMNLSRFGDAIQFLISFPRLQVLEGLTHADNLHAYIIRILQHLPNLISFNVNCTGEDEESFMEKIFATQSKEEKDCIIKRFSNIKKMIFDCNNGYFLNSIMFINKYFTGLKFLGITFQFTGASYSLKHQLFCSLVLDLVRSVKKTQVEMTMTLEMLQECFPIIAYKVFDKSPTMETRNTLRIHVQNQNELDGKARLIIDNNPQACYITVFVSRLSFRKLVLYLFRKSVPLFDVDELKLEIKKRDQQLHHDFEVDISMYDKILSIMPTVKEVLLDIPVSFKEEEGEDEEKITFENKYEKVKKLTLRTGQKTKYQTILNSSHTLFPNLKHLNLQYSCGCWNKRTGEYRLELAELSLETLTVDVTPIKSNTTFQEFFIIEVVFMSDSDRRLFKVTLDFESSDSIGYTELKGLKRGSVYSQVHIIIGSLKCLKLCMYNSSGPPRNQDYLQTGSHRTKHLTIF